MQPLMQCGPIQAPSQSSQDMPLMGWGAELQSINMPQSDALYLVGPAIQQTGRQFHAISVNSTTILFQGAETLSCTNMRADLENMS